MLGEGACEIWPQDVVAGGKCGWVGGFGGAICISCGFLWFVVVTCGFLCILVQKGGMCRSTPMARIHDVAGFIWFRLRGKVKVSLAVRLGSLRRTGLKCEWAAPSIGDCHAFEIVKERCGGCQAGSWPMNPPSSLTVARQVGGQVGLEFGLALFSSPYG
jgi:hypothetical protein